jgi:hypothetical protein
MDASFFGPFRETDYIGHFELHLANKGGGNHHISSLLFTLRGLHDDATLTTWAGDPTGIRVNFPEPLYDKVEVIRSGETIYIDAGITLDMPLSVRVPGACKYVLAEANFQYDSRNRYGVERVFEVSDKRNSVL